MAKGELKLELIHRVVDKFGDEALKGLLKTVIPKNQLREKEAVINNCLKIKERIKMLKERLDVDVKRFFERMKTEVEAILKMNGAERQVFYLNKKKEEIISYSNSIAPYLKARNATGRLIEWVDGIIEDLKKV